jgi:hypothetical protein
MLAVAFVNDMLIPSEAGLLTLLYRHGIISLSSLTKPKGTSSSRAFSAMNPILGILAIDILESGEFLFWTPKY